MKKGLRRWPWRGLPPPPVRTHALMKKGLRRQWQGIRLAWCVRTHALMKKGLRQVIHIERAAFDFRSNTCPDEEGIKTHGMSKKGYDRIVRTHALMKKGLRLGIQHFVAFLDRSNTCPDEEGIKTIASSFLSGRSLFEHMP